MWDQLSLFNWKFRVYFLLAMVLVVAGIVLAVWQLNRLGQQAQTIERIGETNLILARLQRDLMGLEPMMREAILAEDAEMFTTMMGQEQQLIDETLAQAIDLSADLMIPTLQAELRTWQSDLPAKFHTLMVRGESGEWQDVEEWLLRQPQLLSQDLMRVSNTLAEARLVSEQRVEQIRQEGIMGVVIACILLVGWFFFTNYQMNQQTDSLLEKQQQTLTQDSKRIQKQLETANQQLATAAKVARNVASVLDPQHLLDMVVTLITDSFGFYHTGVFLVDDSQEWAVLKAASSVGGQQMLSNQHKLKVGEQGIVGHAIAKQEAVVVLDVEQDATYLKNPLLPETYAEIVLPLKVGRQVLGVLDVQSEEVSAFSEQDIAILQTLADQIAIALQNAMLYQQAKQGQRLTETLHQIGQALSGTLDLDKVLDLILKQVNHIVAHDRGSLLLQEEGYLEVVAYRGFPPEATPKDSRIPLDQLDDSNIYLRIAHSQEPLMIADMSQEPDWYGMANVPNPKAWLGVPLIQENEVFGMLSLAREEAKSYTQEEIKLARAFANQASTALTNARMYHRSERFTEQLQYEVAQRTQTLQEAYQQLEQLDKAKSEFIEIASHELRTPLTILRGYSDILLNDDEILENPYYTKVIQNIQQGSIRLHEIVSDMLDMAKIDNRSLNLHPEPVSLKFIVGSVCKQMERWFEERQHELQFVGLDTLPAIEVDLEALSKVFQHLITNAIKYTPNGGMITITGEVKGRSEKTSGREGVLIRIIDTGIGIAPEYQELIFQKFYQTGEAALHSSGKSKFKGGGPGLGLTIANGIVQAHRGSLWVESTGYDEQGLPGSCFYIALPIRQAPV